MNPTTKGIDNIWNMLIENIHLFHVSWINDGSAFVIFGTKSEKVQ